MGMRSARDRLKSHPHVRYGTEPQISPGKDEDRVKKIDRRAARTRRALHQAMIAQILRGGYDALTIRGLLAEADVGRSTFYAHYAGKDDLFRSGFFEQLRDDIGVGRTGLQEGAASQSKELLPFSGAFFRHAEGYKHVYRALGSRSARSLALGHIRTVLRQSVRRDWPRRSGDGPVPVELAQAMTVDGLISVLTWWLEHEPELPALEVDGLFRRLVLGGIESVAWARSQSQQ